MHSKLQKNQTERTFPYVYADVRGVASVDQYGVEHSVEFTAVDRTKVDLDGAIALISNKQSSMRKWLNVESL